MLSGRGEAAHIFEDLRQVNSKSGADSLANQSVTLRLPLYGVAGGAPATQDMGSNPTTGFTCRPKGPPENVSGSERFRYQSESDIGSTVKSLSRLCSRDEDERAAALEELSQGVLLRLRLDGTSTARLGKETLLHLLRLSCSCPLLEVRETAAELLRAAQVRRDLENTHNLGLLITLMDY